MSDLLNLWKKSSGLGSLLLILVVLKIITLSHDVQKLIIGITALWHKSKVDSQRSTDGTENHGEVVEHEPDILTTDTVDRCQSLEVAVVVEIQDVGVQWLTGLVWMEVQMRDDGRLQEDALAGRAAKIGYSGEAVTMAGKRNESGSGGWCWQGWQEVETWRCLLSALVSAVRFAVLLVTCSVLVEWQIGLRALNILLSEGLHVGSEDLESISVVVEQDIRSSLWHWWKVDHGLGHLDLSSHGLRIGNTGDTTAEDVGKGEQELIDDLVWRLLELRADLGEVSILEKSYALLVYYDRNAERTNVPWNAQEEFSVKYR